MPLLLLDLDNTVADRATAFEHWAETHLDQWAPGDQGAMAFLHEQEGDRRYDSCPRNARRGHDSEHPRMVADRPGSGTAAGSAHSRRRGT